ncbi:hypothetical protein BKA70DRAFT_1194401 [Coprinopsis sp. MPI-PUGE-AT-0042]|nr:hypothetical protein BKA70DRAFT_1194401 [Coprinopsis sp. MPI-PUGE-AT-0042]
MASAILSPFNLPKSKNILVTDELAAPADFVIYESVTTLFKNTDRSAGNPAALILSTSLDLTRWKSVSLKHGVNPTTHIISGAVRFVDLCSLAPPDGPSTEPKFSAVIDLVNQVVSDRKGQDTLVILDDAATLEWIGHSSLDIWRFVRKLRAVCLKANATLIIRHHVASANDPDDLFLQLVDVCSYHVDVRPLYSGRSGAVSGEVAIHAGSLSKNAEPVKLIPRSAALQYRLTDNGPVYFEKGTSEGVL